MPCAVDRGYAVDRGADRGFEQILPATGFPVDAFGSVIVSVPAGVQDAGEGLEGGLGDLGEHGGLAAGLVP